MPWGKNNNWETISTDSDNSELTSRMEVPGGWLVRCLVWDSAGVTTSVSITYFPDPTHAWEMNE